MGKQTPTRVIQSQRTDDTLATELQQRNFCVIAILLSQPDKVSYISAPPIQLLTEALFKEHVQYASNNNNCAMSLEKVRDLEGMK